MKTLQEFKNMIEMNVPFTSKDTKQYEDLLKKEGECLFDDTGSKELAFSKEDMTDLNNKVSESLKNINPDLIRSPNVVTGEDDFVPGLQILRQEGKLSPHTYIVHDLIVNKYKYFSEKSGIVFTLDPKSAEAQIILTLHNQLVDLTEKQENKILKSVKPVFSEFNPNKPKVWSKEGEEFGAQYMNLFQEDLTLLGLIKEKEKNTKKKDKIKDLVEFKINLPHVYLLLSNLLEYNDKYVLAFINYLSTFSITRQKIILAWLFAGKQGTGKGLLIALLGTIFGKNYTSELNADILTEQFNDALENKLIVNFNEVSTDFNKTDKAMQRLKAYITGEDFLLNPKGVKSSMVTNNFIVILSSNNINAVKIESDDRRFNYFRQGRPLKQAVQEEMNITIKKFISNLKSETVDFAEFLGEFDYNEETAGDLIHNDSRAKNIESTENVKKVFFEKVNDLEYDYFESKINNLKFELTEDEINALGQETILALKDSDNLLEELREEFERKCIGTATIKNLFKIIVGPEYKSRALLKVISGNMALPAKGIKINGTNKNRYPIIPAHKLEEVKRIEEEEETAALAKATIG